MCGLTRLLSQVRFSLGACWVSYSLRGSPCPPWSVSKEPAPVPATSRALILLSHTYGQSLQSKCLLQLFVVKLWHCTFISFFYFSYNCHGTFSPPILVFCSTELTLGYFPQELPERLWQQSSVTAQWLPARWTPAEGESWDTAGVCRPAHWPVSSLISSTSATPVAFNIWVAWIHQSHFLAMCFGL